MHCVTAQDSATAIEAMNWDYKHLSAEEFLQEAFERAKRLEALKFEIINRNLRKDVNK